MQRLVTPSGTKFSYDRYGSGPPLVLVHGGFSDHVTNWEFVKPLLEPRFSVYAVARRGRGETIATEGHSIDDEADDVAALLDLIGEPVFLLGHSYGAHVALAVAAERPQSVRKLVLYEAPWPNLLPPALFARLESLAQEERWDDFAATFFGEGLLVPADELRSLRDSALWPPIVADGKASLGDLRALHRRTFDAERYRGLSVPTLLQTGSTSPRHFYLTDALAAALTDARIEELPGQAHEGMTTAPELYAANVLRFLDG